MHACVCGLRRKAFQCEYRHAFKRLAPKAHPKVAGDTECVSQLSARSITCTCAVVQAFDVFTSTYTCAIVHEFDVLFCGTMHIIFCCFCSRSSMALCGQFSKRFHSCVHVVVFTHAAFHAVALVHTKGCLTQCARFHTTIRLYLCTNVFEGTRGNVLQQ